VDEEKEVARHKFKVGEVVDYSQPRLTLPTIRRRYEIVRLLPSDGRQFQYRIKALGESSERIAQESELSRGSSESES